jgi:hypothetical protein
VLDLGRQAVRVTAEELLAVEHVAGTGDEDNDDD